MLRKKKKSIDYRCFECKAPLKPVFRSDSAAVSICTCEWCWEPHLIVQMGKEIIIADVKCIIRLEAEEDGDNNNKEK